MYTSIVKKKVHGGAAPRRTRLEDYRRPGDVTGGIRARSRASEQGCS